MFIKRLYIEKYKMFNKKEIKFSNFKSELFKEIYGNPTYTLLIGKNGSGKTTIMSFIARIFNYLEKDPYLIGSDFELEYIINNNQEVTLSFQDSNIFITVNDQKSLIYSRYTKKKEKNYFEKKYENIIKFNEIKKYLPIPIVTSTFSMHGEYPNDRPSNFGGTQILRNYDISNIYGKNHWGMDISIGILRFLIKFNNDADKLNDLLKLFELKFKGSIAFNPRYGCKDEKIYIDDELIDSDDYNIITNISNINFNYFIRHVIKGHIFINNIYFERNDKEVSLNNMSSGEKILFIRLFSILSSIKNRSVVIIEEPELHLNASWNKHFIPFLTFFIKTFDSHLFIATHNPLIINTILKDNIFYLGEKEEPENTFLGNESYVNEIYFQLNKSNNNIENYLYDKINIASIEELKEIQSILGESFLKFYCFKKIMEREKENA